MNTIDAIKKSMKSKTLVIGYNSTVRLLKNNKLSLVVIAKNAPEHVKDELKSLSKINNIDFVESDKSNIELGATCRKTFGVMVL